MTPLSNAFKFARIWSLVGGVCAWVVFGGWTATGAPPTDAPPIPVLTVAAPALPTLGIMAISEEATLFADLLFAEFSTSGNVKLVERERLQAVFKELELSLLQKSDFIQAGRLTHADALLFVDIVQGSLSIRVSETQRGERLYQYVFPYQTNALSRTCAAVVEHFAAVSSTLTTPGEKIYLAVRPTHMRSTVAGNTELIKKLRALLEARLLSHDGIVLVEREDLAHIAAESSLGFVDASLSAAHYIVRSTATESGTGKLQVDLNIASTTGEEGEVFTAVVDENSVNDTVNFFSAGIVQALGCRSTIVSNSYLNAEAKIQRYIAQLLIEEQDYLGGVQCLEAAYLLQPDYPGICNQLVQHIGRYLSKSAYQRSPAEYMGYIRWLRVAMDAARSAPWSTWYLLPGMGLEPLTFLMTPPGNLSADQALAFKACRRELKAYCEWAVVEIRQLHLGQQDAIIPLFYDSPAEAFRHLKPVLTDSPYLYSQQHTFTRITYWDVREANAIWMAYLDELSTSDSCSQQFKGLASQCFYSGAFAKTSFHQTKNDPHAEACAKKLFKWLDTDSENLQWGATHARNGLWHALALLPVSEQDHYFRYVMIPFIANQPDEMRQGFVYIKARLPGSQTSENTQFPVDTVVGEMLHAVEEKHPAIHARWVGQLEQQDWYRDLMHIRTPASSGPSLPLMKSDSIVLFDSADHQVSGFFGGTSLLRESNSVWMVWDHVRWGKNVWRDSDVLG